MSLWKTREGHEQSNSYSLFIFSLHQKLGRAQIKLPNQMRINCIAAVFLVTCFISNIYTGSLPCGTTGMTVLHANDGGGFLFYVFREAPDIYFQIPGKEISFPNGLTGPRRYLIDGIFYETVLVKPNEFMKMEKGNSDLDVLKKHC